MKTDIVVIGAGALGLSTALHARQHRAQFVALHGLEHSGRPAGSLRACRVALDNYHRPSRQAANAHRLPA